MGKNKKILKDEWGGVHAAILTVYQLMLLSVHRRRAMSGADELACIAPRLFTCLFRNRPRFQY